MRAEATGIPVVDTLSLSAYLVEAKSTNDHLSPMGANEPRPSCYHGGSNSAWYQITTSIKGQVGVRLNDYRGTDIHSIALYRGASFADLIELGCFQFPPMGGSFPEPGVRSGDVLYFQVIADGPYWVSAVIGPTSSIDSLADAEDLSIGFLNYGPGWTTERMTVDVGEPLPCGGTGTAWLKYVPDQSGTVTFEIMDSVANDVLGLYRGSNYGDLQLLSCGELNRYTDWDLATRVETRLTADLSRGATYYLQVGTTQGPGGYILPFLSRGAPPANDSSASAIFLDETHHSVNATTAGAFTRPIGTPCGIFETVWYRVTAPTTGTLEVTIDTKATGSPLYAPALAINRGGTGELLACGGDTAATVTKTAPAQAGASYLIAVQSAGHPGDFRMHWEVK